MPIRTICAESGPSFTAAATGAELLKKHGLAIRPPSGRGYLYQLMACWGWTTLPWLRRPRQPTLILHGTDDPMVPLSNAKILAALIPNSKVYAIDDGHLFLISRAAEVAPIIRRFLADDTDQTAA